MRKSVKFASLVLALVLVTLCFVASTFAKYMSTLGTSGNQTARVAYWGFTSSSAVTIDNLFKNTYNNESVVSSTASAVIAPGTAGSAAIKFVAAEMEAPEVKYQVKLTVTATEDGKEVDTDSKLKNALQFSWSGDEEDYVPMVAFTGSSAIKVFAAGTKPTTIDATIYWKWDDSDYDKTIGEFAALPEITVKVAAEAEQISTTGGGD